MFLHLWDGTFDCVEVEEECFGGGVDVLPSEIQLVNLVDSVCDFCHT